MLSSTRWLNDYLDPPASPEEQADLLTRAGFPLEGTLDVEVSDGTDIQQDFEMTSNRGDCVCHVGLAREVAAISGRTLVTPAVELPSGGAPAADAATVENREPEMCPLYTARVIRGLTVKPSPDWLADRLRAIGQIPRNNVVDATNFVLFEMGQPTHVFDLATLEGNSIIIRRAKCGERFLPIGEGEAEIGLTTDDLVIADANRAVAMAGVKGGALTAVTDSTTDVLIEAATFAPVSVRNSSRRHGIASDSSYRFERGVHPGAINAAAERLTALLLEVAGGELCDGVVADGAAIPEPRTVRMRPERCWKIMGVPISDEDIVAALDRLGFQPKMDGDEVVCTVPLHRLDIEREIDLVEEIGRMIGLDMLPVDDTLQVRVAEPQPFDLGRRAVTDTLIGLGFVESVTHSLIGEHAATPFLPAGAQTLRVDDERARSAPILRPSLLPSLLRVRAHNLDHGAETLWLFEQASTFWREGDGHVERVRLTLLMDMEDATAGLRPLRGVVERLVAQLLGRGAVVDVAPDESAPWFAPGAVATSGDEMIGRLGIVSPSARSPFGLETPLLAAELELPAFYDRYPPDAEARPLPSFPAIERDLTVVAPESMTWRAIEDAIAGLGVDHLDGVAFVTTFRGKSVDAGHKALTLRLRFRHDDRTLTHDEVDPQVEAIMATVTSMGAEIRR